MFIVDDDNTLSKPENRYVQGSKCPSHCYQFCSVPQRVGDAISYTVEEIKMNDMDFISFTWPAAPQGVEIMPRWLQGWKGRWKKKR